MISLEGITKKYDDKVVLNEVSLNIGEGELLAVTGPSGCGKSTLLNIIGLLERFDSGALIIDGDVNVPPASKRANMILREKISYLFQNFALVDDETVSYNLKLALKYCKGDKKEAIANVLKLVGLGGYENKKIFKLSGGEQQRIAVARAMLKPSKIILADEPTGSLDTENRDIIIGLIKTLNNEGKTIVIVTHDMDVANQCERVVAL